MTSVRFVATKFVYLCYNEFMEHSKIKIYPIYTGKSHFADSKDKVFDFDSIYLERNHILLKKVPAGTRWRRKRKRRIYKKTNGKCYLCNNILDFEKMTIDHVIPVSKGGSGLFHNLMPAHEKCNQKKGDKIL